MNIIKKFFISREVEKNKLISYTEIKTEDDFVNWYKLENPHEFLTEEEKVKISKVHTTLNNSIRRGETINLDRDFFDSIISRKNLQKGLIVYRGVKTCDYERELAKARGLEKDKLFFNGFIYTSLYRNNYYNNNIIEQKIYVPKGKNYLFTGQYSNTPETKELVLPRDTTLKILKEENKNGKVYMTLMVV